MGSTILLGTDFSKGIQVRSRHIGRISKGRSYKHSQGSPEEFRWHINKFSGVTFCFGAVWTTKRTPNELQPVLLESLNPKL